MGPLIDRFGRPVTGVRISVNSTSSCNLHCIFCHREGEGRGHEVEMTPEEIERIARILKGFSVTKVKLTGGEPTVRDDILEIVERLGRLGLDDLSMTTNGYRMPELAKGLKDAGLKRVNLSLHSTYPDRYRFITGGGDYEKAIRAIKASLDAGFFPVKLNVVVLKGVNDDELERFIEFARELGAGDALILQFIELQMVGSAIGGFYRKYHHDLKEYEAVLKRRAVKDVERTLHRRHQYKLPNGVWVEIVRPMHNSIFCMNDTRIRITHDGKFKPCLFRNDNLVDFLGAMRGGASDEELAERFKLAVRIREPFFKPLSLPSSSDELSASRAS